MFNVFSVIFEHGNLQKKYLESVFRKIIQILIYSELVYKVISFNEQLIVVFFDYEVKS